MTGDQVISILDALTASGVTAWVDGGWGVDALVGEQTRPHSDLDLVVEAVGVIRQLLADEGFQLLRDWLPTAIAFEHPDGRQVDLHPVDPTSDGGGDQVQRDGKARWHYNPAIDGTIDGRLVRCCSLDTQIRAHTGYEPGSDDFADMRLLQDRFGCELPAPYGRGT